MQEKKQYTLYDIAAIAKVTPSTVSRVVNGVPGISKSTRTKVQRVLDAYHYVPNETARGLAMQSSKLIGILISDIRLTHHADGVFYVEQELTKRGYCCLILNTGVEEDSQAKHIQMLSQRKVDARRRPHGFHLPDGDGAAADRDVSAANAGDDLQRIPEPAERLWRHCRRAIRRGKGCAAAGAEGEKASGVCSGSRDAEQFGRAAGL